MADEKRTKHITFRIPPSLRDRIDRCAQEQARPVSDVIRRAVICYCAARPTK